ncbi:MAG: DUF4303 domain-containing protein [Saprospiraceae bacterium]
MENNLKYISIKTAEKIKKLFKSLSKDYVKLIYEKEKEICSFGVFTDSDISNFFFGYNTKKGIEELKKRGIQNNKRFPDTKLKIDSMKWWLPEWINDIDEEVFRYDEREIELFNTLEDLIEQVLNSDPNCEKDFFSDYKSDIFDLFCQSLMELKDENIFLKVSENFFLIVQEQDNGIYGTREKSLSKILNKNQLKAFLKFDKAYLTPN